MFTLFFRLWKSAAEGTRLLPLLRYATGCNTVRQRENVCTNQNAIVAIEKKQPVVLEDVADESHSLLAVKVILSHPSHDTKTFQTTSSEQNRFLNGLTIDVF